MNIDQSTQSTGTELWKSVEPEVMQATHLENAAQELAKGLHTKFSDIRTISHGEYVFVISKTIRP